MPVRKGRADTSEEDREVAIAVTLLLMSFGGSEVYPASESDRVAAQEVMEWERELPRAALKVENERVLAKWLELTGKPLSYEHGLPE